MNLLLLAIYVAIVFMIAVLVVLRSGRQKKTFKFTPENTKVKLDFGKARPISERPEYKDFYELENGTPVWKCMFDKCQNEAQEEGMCSEHWSDCNE